MEKVYEVINKEIAKFNLSYDQDDATENQKKYTKQFENLDHINTSRVSADASWEFSKTIEKILAIVEEGVNTFEEVPEGAILKGTPEYKERVKNEEPKSVVTGFRKRLGYTQLKNIQFDGFSIITEKTFYFEGDK